MHQRNAVLVLAAGESRRMGAPKQLLPFGNSTLLESGLHLLTTSHLGPVHCVLGAHFEKVRSSIPSLPTLKVVYNPDWQKGMGSSIAAGVKAVQEAEKDVERILVVLADQPFIPQSHLKQLLEKSAAHPGFIVGTQYQERVGVPAVFPRQDFHRLTGLNEAVGARKLIQSAEKVVSVAASEEWLFDIDHPEDYKKALWNFKSTGVDH